MESPDERQPYIPLNPIEQRDIFPLYNAMPDNDGSAGNPEHLEVLRPETDGYSDSGVVPDRVADEIMAAQSVPPYNCLRPYRRVEEAECDTQIIREHYGILAGDDPTVGIAIPTVSCEPYVHADSTFYIISNVLEGTAGYRAFSDNANWSAKGFASSGEKNAAVELANRLYDYYNHLYEGHMTTSLAYISVPEKYIILPDGRPALSDTDPIVLNLTTLVGQDIMLDDLDKLHHWSSSIDTTLANGVTNLKQLFEAEFTYTAGRPADTFTSQESHWRNFWQGEGRAAGGNQGYY